MDGGATLDDGIEILSWKVSGMDCGACVAKVEKAVRHLAGICDVQVNLMSETMTLGRRPDGASEDAVEHPAERRRRRGPEGYLLGDDPGGDHRIVAGHSSGFGYHRSGHDERVAPVALEACRYRGRPWP
jgi:copper chaperone CopZ